jgi:hypothetical protein
VSSRHTPFPSSDYSDAGARPRAGAGAVSVAARAVAEASRSSDWPQKLAMVGLRLLLEFEENITTWEWWTLHCCRNRDLVINDQRLGIVGHSSE